jgi:hypothetical protein
VPLASDAACGGADGSGQGNSTTTATDDAVGTATATAAPSSAAHTDDVSAPQPPMSALARRLAARPPKQLTLRVVCEGREQVQEVALSEQVSRLMH